MLEVGDTVVWRANEDNIGTIIDIEQYGNTPTYTVEWNDNRCPLTGHRDTTSLLSAEIRKTNENR